VAQLHERYVMMMIMGSYSGRHLYVQARYNLFVCQQYKQSCRRNSAFATVERAVLSIKLPEDEPWGSKPIEDTVKIKILV